MRLTSSPATLPILARVLPFLVYIGLMALDGLLSRWIAKSALYGVQIAVTIAVLAYFWKEYEELRRPTDWQWRHALLALAVGIGVFAAWIHLDAEWMQFGEGRGLAATLSAEVKSWVSILLRIIGAVMVVPVMEELFWRSYLLRWIEHSQFQEVQPATVGWSSILITSLLFGAEHHLWLAGIVAGIAYALLYRATNNLWAVIIAHALTNALLEYWVGRTGNWQFI